MKITPERGDVVLVRLDDVPAVRIIAVQGELFDAPPKMDGRLDYGRNPTDWSWWTCEVEALVYKKHSRLVPNGQRLMVRLSLPRGDLLAAGDPWSEFHDSPLPAEVVREVKLEGTENGRVR